jgi:hypothetical protein
LGFTLIHHSEKEWQSMLDQQLMSTAQSHSTQAISVANNHGHFAQAFWVQVFS